MSQTRKQRREAAAKAARTNTPAVSAVGQSSIDPKLYSAYVQVEKVEAENASLHDALLEESDRVQHYQDELRKLGLALRDKQFAYFVSGFTAAVLVTELARLAIKHLS